MTKPSTILAMLTRCRRGYLCDMLYTLAAAAGAFWYANYLPPSAPATGFTVIGWWLIGCAGLVALTGAIDMVGVAVSERSRDSRSA